MRVLATHTYGSVLRRVTSLTRDLGFRKTLSVLFAALDDEYLRSFDRKFGVRTSGYVLLAETSFTKSRLQDATQYRPVNGWGLRKLLAELRLPRTMHFVDLGCGLGRACLVAAEYGFEEVSGVELALELCEAARQNVAKCRLDATKAAAIKILHMDAIEFCKTTDADVFFMFRPFSWQFLQVILGELKARARMQHKSLTIIYSEKMALAGTHAHAIEKECQLEKIHERGFYGQAFYVYRCSG